LSLLQSIGNSDKNEGKETTKRYSLFAVVVHVGSGPNEPLGDDVDDMSDFVGGGPQGGRCMYHLRTFNLSSDPKGDCLKLKSCKGQSRWYSLPHEARMGSVCMDPVAFWL
jgi:hypothetical protein